MKQWGIMEAQKVTDVVENFYGKYEDFQLVGLKQVHWRVIIRHRAILIHLPMIMEYQL